MLTWLVLQYQKANCPLKEKDAENTKKATIVKLINLNLFPSFSQVVFPPWPGIYFGLSSVDIAQSNTPNIMNKCCAKIWQNWQIQIYFNIIQHYATFCNKVAKRSQHFNTCHCGFVDRPGRQIISTLSGMKMPCAYEKTSNGMAPKRFYIISEFYPLG